MKPSCRIHRSSVSLPNCVELGRPTLSRAAEVVSVKNFDGHGGSGSGSEERTFPGRLLRRYCAIFGSSAELQRHPASNFRCLISRMRYWPACQEINFLS